MSKVNNARTILDIGSNIGLLTLAARNRFPTAVIHAYEPNPDIQMHLASHCDAVGAKMFAAAVGAQAGSISLKMSNEGSLHTLTQSGGSIPQVAFSDAVARLGGVDLLKLDCEGAEWDIFTDPTPWASVRDLVMEYHLWAKAHSTAATVRDTLFSLGFEKIDVRDDGKQWGLAFTSR